MDHPERLETLVAIMDRLREPEGCPWDREQSYETLRRYLLEECYEAVEAIDRGDPGGLREELGDLLFQIVFLSRIAKEEGKFTIEDVIRGIAEKMVRRHPPCLRQMWRNRFNWLGVGGKPEYPGAPLLPRWFGFARTDPNR